jgi:O-methyltransferase
MSFYRTFRSAMGRQIKARRYGRIYGQFKDFTMISRETYVDNLVLAQRISGLSGCIIECGVWRGGMSAGLAKVLGANRQYFLFDSFEGLPPAKEIDGDAALRWQQNKGSSNYYDNCAAEEKFAKRAMTLSGARSFHLIKGWFDQTLPGFTPPEPIALLRLDGDWYDSTMVCLDSLFHHMAPGGLIILDDYHTWDGCSKALHDFLSKHSAVERICSSGNICFCEKRSTVNPARDKK